MWARIDGGKYHWFEYNISNYNYRAACGEREEYLGRGWLRRDQPRHADRCKRCVAALERRKDENAGE